MGFGIQGRGSNLGLNLGNLPANIGGAPHQISMLLFYGAEGISASSGQQHPRFGERSHRRFARPEQGRGAAEVGRFAFQVLLEHRLPEAGKYKLDTVYIAGAMVYYQYSSIPGNIYYEFGLASKTVGINFELVV